MLPNIVERIGTSRTGTSRSGDDESLTAEIARVEAFLAERRYEIASSRGAARVVGRTLMRAAHAAARALLGNVERPERPARTAADTRRRRGRSAP